MLLNELTTSDEKRIAKINRALKESYGFTLNSSVGINKLQSLHAKVTNDLYSLKLNQATARDAEYIEKVLVKEGLEILRESAMMAGPGGRALERVVGLLSEFVRHACEVGDEYEEAIRDAMKQYRSSKYRFNDDHVEYEVRNLTADCTGIEECGGPVMFEGEELEEEELDEVGDRHAEHDWVKGIKRDQAKARGDLDTELRLAEPEDDEADDYFSYQAKRKNTEMKEGYVKQLRQLLEAETDQAESLIAAKSFSQELQDMVEKLGRLVNEDLPAVSAQMRDSHGADVATGFEDTAGATLSNIMDQLKSSKQELDNSVSAIADGGMPAVSNDMDDFGADAELDAEMDDLDIGDDELEMTDDELEMGDELGGMDAAAGPEEEELGRAKKESVQALRNKIVEMQGKIARAKRK